MSRHMGISKYIAASSHRLSGMGSSPQWVDTPCKYSSGYLDKLQVSVASHTRIPLPGLRVFPAHFVSLTTVPFAGRIAYFLAWRGSI